MRLTWNDAAATVLTGGVVALYVAFRADADLPLVSGPRALAVAVLVLGLGACALGSAAADQADRRPAGRRVLGLLGGIALVTALATIITGSEAMLAVLVAATGLLWLAATVRHLFAGGSRRQEILR